MNFAQFLSRKIKILVWRLYSRKLKNDAWVEDTRFIFLIFHTFVSKKNYLFVNKKNYWRMYGKLGKNNWASSSHATSFKLGEQNLLPSILTLRFTNCVKFNCWTFYLPLGSRHSNTNFWPLCLSVKRASITVIKPIWIDWGPL